MELNFYELRYKYYIEGKTSGGHRVFLDGKSIGPLDLLSQSGGECFLE